jgi:hypothetical protein
MCAEQAHHRDRPRDRQPTATPSEHEEKWRRSATATDAFVAFRVVRPTHAAIVAPASRSSCGRLSMRASRLMDTNSGRWTAQLDGDFVVFLIGAELRDPELAGPAGELLLAMINMLVELEQDPSIGLLGYQVFGALNGVIVQYWRSFEALENYAKNPSANHAPVWREWNRLAADDKAGAGIWHETFKVGAGQYEAVYQNMPVMGLQKAGTPTTVTAARTSARQRIGA